jgi:protein O-GlcNAc transferase
MKIISFSMWGSITSFQTGALENIRLAERYYPDWKCLFFLRDDVPLAFVRELTDAGALVALKKQTKGEWEGLFWRFEPISSPLVTHTLSRDCDSRLNPREAAAVQEWLLSGKTLHTMRDHFEHNIPILGGMFGIKHWPRFKALYDSWTRFDAKGDDQHLLTELVWPELREDALAHDRYADGLDMPNRDGAGTYRYRPLQQLGQHDIRHFPAHDPLDPLIHGEHVGARVG